MVLAIVYNILSLLFLQGWIQVLISLWKSSPKILPFMITTKHFSVFVVCILVYTTLHLGFPGGASGKESTCQRWRCRFDPWVEKIPWRRKWQCTPVFLLGESHEQRSLAGYSPWGPKELDTTELLSTHTICTYICVFHDCIISPDRL